MGKKSSFYSSAAGEPHRQRTKEILKKHPEIRQLIGRNPSTFFFILGLVGLQICMAYLLKESKFLVSSNVCLHFRGFCKSRVVCYD